MNKSKKIIVAIIIIILIIVISFIFLKSEVKNDYGNEIKYKDNENKEDKNDTILIYDIEEGYLTVPYNKDAKTNNYNFNENFKNDNGYYKYEDDNYISILGIDVSEHQGDIDWKEVKKSGVQFAILRLGYRGYGKEGKIVLDKKFEENYKNAKEEGLKLGIYFFSQAINIEEVEQEANFVLENLNGRNIDFPIVFDLEKIKNDDARTDNLSQDEINNMTLKFCEIIENKGYTPCIYGNSKTFTTRMKLELFNNYDKWYADYQEKPLYPYDFNLWQYTESGKVNGIEGNVDIDLYFKGE